MAFLLASHWLPTPPLPGAPASLLEAVGVGAFLTRLVVFFVLQCVVYYAAPALLAGVVPAAELQKPKTRATLASYVSSVLHHVCVVPLAAYALWHHAAGHGVAWGALNACVPLSLAYFLVDSALYAIPEAVAGVSFEYAIHHGLGLALTIAAAVSPPTLIRWATSLFLSEASSIFLCASYVLRKAGRDTGRLATAVTAAFVLSFAATRVVNLPIAYYALLTDGAHALARAQLGVPGLASLAVVLAMQFFWFYKILLTAFGGGSKKEA